MSATPGRGTSVLAAFLKPEFVQESGGRKCGDSSELEPFQQTREALSFCMENGNILESRFKTLTYILHVKSLKDWVQQCIKPQNLQIFEWFL